MKTILFISVCLFVMLTSFGVLSCDKPDENKANAQIIGFNYNKCGCCWGWIIKYGKDTIKTYSLPSNFKPDDKYPISVKIELDKMVQNCSKIKHYDYYKIKSIEIIK